MKDGLKLGGIFVAECHDKYGEKKWADTFPNMVVDQGLNHVLDLVFTGGDTQVSPWYIGLVATTGPTFQDSHTMASHTGWTEFTAYNESSREIWLESRSSQTLTNSTKAQFTISANNSTIGGAFLASNSTLGAGGILMSGGAFTGGDKAADSGDVLSVTYTLSAADA